MLVIILKLILLPFSLCSIFFCVFCFFLFVLRIIWFYDFIVCTIIMIIFVIIFLIVFLLKCFFFYLFIFWMKWFYSFIVCAVIMIILVIVFFIKYFTLFLILWGNLMIFIVWTIMLIIILTVIVMIMIVMWGEFQFMFIFLGDRILTIYLFYLINAGSFTIYILFAMFNLNWIIKWTNL